MKVLLIVPKYPASFWSFKYALRFISRKAAVPLPGLITVSAMLPAMKKWMQAHKYPFVFNAETSVNLADDDKLMTLMVDAITFAVYGYHFQTIYGFRNSHNLIVF